MFKNIFKAAKNLVKSPIGQVGIGILAPQFAGASGVLGGIGTLAAKNPALFQAGIGLLGGAKPQDVLRNVALGAGSAALMGGRGGVSEFFTGQPQTTQVGSALKPSGFESMQNQMQDLGRSTIEPKLLEGAAGEKGGLLDSLIKDTKIITNPDGSQSVVPVTDFFEKYSPLLKLGTVGASIAAAALGEDQASMIYDPQQNPYLTGQVKITDVYTPAGFKQGGGINDFPEKDGMINGPGDGQSDDIPAMLSDGEFVMTKQAVMAAGNGDRDKGTKAMYSMMNNLEDKAKSMGIGRM